MKRILVTGGAGFIGSALIRYIMQTQADVVVNLDKLTYAGNLERLEGLESSPRYSLLKNRIQVSKRKERGICQPIR